MSKTKVLIAGAGPTGLTLALWLTRLGVPVRIFDKATGPGETSRDGARSTVRHGLNIGFPGGTYEQAFYVADVKGTGNVTRNGMDTTISSYGFAIVMPVRQSGSLRLIGIVPKAHEADETISFEAIRADIERETGVTVNEVNWFSTYRVHHRVAERFRAGRVFLVGDAGHIHSPAGGQGMNTGMGDAVNLAWKLGAVAQGRADPRLLDSYEPERIAFAHKLIESTDKVFRFITNRSRLVGLFRRYVMPKVMNIGLHTSFGSRAFFGVISQTAIQYRAGPISSGVAGKVSGGDRLPYVTGAGGDNFEPLRSLDWQVHVYGEVNCDFRAMLAPTGVAVHAFAWTDAAVKAGLQRDAAYLVRPDGHVALASPVQEAAAFQRYLAGLAIRPRTAERAPYRVPGTMHSLA
ncbi:FAD-dependent monooxygenase [Mesorhizobium sp.]|uniref:FAD-dependent monooxygenase n=1 Tax=Mesorhizobium sp. TaxID=1871066 RepID=UPI001220B51D|nr:FAD-dependent monooxygenase [Mesorhizobium sp.]TIQ05753.1 MAG: hypothetical protein E5X50_19895 [Mesorhizobium sp.]